jgi:F-type H+-transporting ATPase subunit b
MELYTIVVQILNFLIFFFLLSKFLIKPVMDGLEKRREYMKNKAEEGEQKILEAENIKEEFSQKIKEIEKERKDIIDKAKEDADEYKKNEMEKIKFETEERRKKNENIISEEREKELTSFKDGFNKVFIEQVNEVLKSISNSSLQEQVINVFLKKLDEVDAEKVKYINDNGNVFEIATASSFANKETLEKKLKEKGFIFDDIKYSLDESLILGVELRVSGYVLSWSIKEIFEKFKYQ